MLKNHLYCSTNGLVFPTWVFEEPVNIGKSSQTTLAFDKNPLAKWHDCKLTLVTLILRGEAAVS